jgi:hypothetical protein
VAYESALPMILMMVMMLIMIIAIVVFTIYIWVIIYNLAVINLALFSSQGKQTC